MAIVDWQEVYSIGMPEIDAQHKVLFDLINELWEILLGRSPVENQRIVIEKLEHYTISHFAAEEIFMRTINYPDFDTHKQAHEQFVQRIADEKASLIAGNKLSLDIVRFLKDWLVNHIIVSDKNYAGFFRQKPKPSSFLGRFFGNLLGKN